MTTGRVPAQASSRVAPQPTCHPAPAKLNQAACAKAEAAYARVHKEQLDYFGRLCAGSVGSDWFAVAPFHGLVFPGLVAGIARDAEAASVTR